QQKLALETLDEASKQTKTDVEFLIGLSELYANLMAQTPSLKTQAQAKALQTLNRADKIKTANAPLRLKVAEGYNTLGDSARAAQVYLELLKDLPDLPALRVRVRARLAEIYLRANELQPAVEQLEAIIKEDPTNPQAYYFLGNIALEQRKWSDAIDHFNKSI